MSQNINSSNRMPLYDCRWTVTSLERGYLRKGPSSSPLTALPLKLFPILSARVNYFLEIKAAWQGIRDVQLSQVQRCAQLAKVKLTSNDASKAKMLEFCEFVREVTGSEVMIRAVLRADKGSTKTRWNLFVDDQLMLQDIFVPRIRNDIIKKIWNDAVRQKFGETSRELAFSPALKSECNRNTELWQRLVEATVIWSNTSKSKEAQAIRSSKLAQYIWDSRNRPILKTSDPTLSSSKNLPTTSCYTALQDHVQQIIAEKLLQLLTRLHRAIDAPSALTSSRFSDRSLSAQGQGVKRKRAPSSTTTKAQKRPRITYSGLPERSKNLAMKEGAQQGSSGSASCSLHPAYAIADLYQAFCSVDLTQAFEELGLDVNQITTEDEDNFESDLQILLQSVLTDEEMSILSSIWEQVQTNSRPIIIDDPVVPASQMVARSPNDQQTLTQAPGQNELFLTVSPDYITELEMQDLLRSGSAEVFQSVFSQEAADK